MVKMESPIQKPPNSLELTDASTISDYIISCRKQSSSVEKDTLADFVDGVLRVHAGRFHVTIAVGVYIAEHTVQSSYHFDFNIAGPFQPSPIHHYYLSAPGWHLPRSVRDMTLIETLSKIICFSSLILTFFTVIHFPPGLVGGILWLPKLWVSAWAPFLALLSSLGAVMAAVAGEYLAVIAGLLGALLALRHTIIVTRPYGNFAAEFGDDWLERIPAGLKARLGSARYCLIQPEPAEASFQQNIIIGKSGAAEDPLLCDIWQPAPKVPRTGLALIYLHGGAWQALDKDFLTRPLFRRLASQGHVIMDVAYSLAPAGDLNRMMADVKQAIIWMKEHAREFNVNPDRIVLMGVSGGAHLALMAAYAPDHPAFGLVAPEADMTVRGVISMFGITDLCAFFREYGRSTRRQPEYSSQITDDMRPRNYDKTWLDRFLTRNRIFPAYRHANMPGGILLLVNLLGGTFKEIPDVYRLASPLFHVGKHCPPTLQICASQDFMIDPAHGRRLRRALQEAGIKSVHIETPETVHGFDQYFGVSRRISPAAQSVTYDLERFLALMCAEEI